MLFDSLIKNTSEILKIIYKSSQSSDIVLSNLLREKKYIGSKERQFISETIFSIFRNYTFINNISEIIFENINNNTYYQYIFSLLIFANNKQIDFNYNPNELLARIYPNKSIDIYEFIIDYLTKNNIFESKDVVQWTEKTKIIIDNFTEKYKNEINTNNCDNISNLYSLPAWICDNLKSNGIASGQLAVSLNKPASVCIRVVDNNSVFAVKQMLENKGIPFTDSKLVPNCIILRKRAKIDDTDEYKSALFEIQDEGSQLISYALSPQNNSTVLDACAGAGGKTLHISDINVNIKEIIASDNNFLRLKEFTKRLNRYDKKNISTLFIKSMNYNDINKQFKNKQFDYVLLDAPCTGLGTARRDPLKKFKITPKIANKMQLKQLEIINTYSKFVKVGGVLVYATCSILSIENIDVVNIFLNSNKNFVPDNLYNIFIQNGIKPFEMNCDSHYLELYPHIHNTDGFFMARMKRVK